MKKQIKHDLSNANVRRLIDRFVRRQESINRLRLMQESQCSKTAHYSCHSEHLSVHENVSTIQKSSKNIFRFISDFIFSFLLSPSSNQALNFSDAQKAYFSICSHFESKRRDLQLLYVNHHNSSTIKLMSNVGERFYLSNVERFLEIKSEFCS